METIRRPAYVADHGWPRNPSVGQLHALVEPDIQPAMGHHRDAAERLIDHVDTPARTTGNTELRIRRF